MATGNRIVKNTSYLYGKIAITMFVSLYTTRLILNALGESDYGIYNVVGGVMGMLGFLNAAMADASLRFMSYAEGEGNEERKSAVQNISSVADAVETATLYVGGEAVVTLNNVALAANDKTAAVGTGRNDYSNIENPTEITFTYKPHTFGTFNAYIELKSGDKIVKTNEVEVVIAEEKVESDATLAGSSFANILR